MVFFFLRNLSFFIFEFDLKCLIMNITVMFHENFIFKFDLNLDKYKFNPLIISLDYDASIFDWGIIPNRYGTLSTFHLSCVDISMTSTYGNQWLMLCQQGGVEVHTLIICIILVNKVVMPDWLLSCLLCQWHFFF